VDLPAGQVAELIEVSNNVAFVNTTVEPQPGDSDADGCSDAQESGADAHRGGLRDPANHWDFYDTWMGTDGVKDGVVSGGDIARVVVRFGTSAPTAPTPQQALQWSFIHPIAMTGYHADFDRGGTGPGGDAWDLLPPDGSISGGDIAAVAAQFMHACMSPMMGM
jgi:hypothetical protein